MLLTSLVTVGIHETGRDAHEQDALVLVLDAELGDGDVQGPLGDGVGARLVDAALCYDVEVRHARRDGDDLLGSALEDEGREEVEEVDGADHVYFEVVEQILLEDLGFLASVVCVC
jgi:hypothetical protein